MPGPVTVRIHGRIAIADVDHPPVNALSHGVRAGLWEAVERVDASPDLDALVIICAGRTFFSGADIKEFGKPAQDPQLPQLTAAARGLGFFFCGLGPAFADGDDLILMQRLSEPLDTGKLQLFTDEAKDMVAFIEADRKAVATAGR